MDHPFLYHITHPETLAAAEKVGGYRADSLSTEGFTHCSFREQMLKTANRFCRGQKGLRILKIDPARLASEIKLEPADNGELFPHVYGEINLPAILEAMPFEPDPDGEFRTLPEGCV